MILSAIFAFSFPFFFSMFEMWRSKEKKLKYSYICLFIYIFVILFFTLLKREPSLSRNRINLNLFWSYAFFDKADYRWQIYMNVFLFIPFGALLAHITHKSFIKCVFAGMVFSCMIEIVQLIFGLGLCELDDVFHNTLGNVIGFGHWIIVERITSMIMHE